MAGSARYTALLDACVLYPAPVRDLLMSLASAQLFHARWTDRIQDEWVESLLTQRPDLDPKALANTVTLMNKAVLDSTVVQYESLIDTLTLPDPNDRHVLAAAIRGHADAIVTFNLVDFPSAYLADFDIEVQHPDDFIANQFELHQLRAIGAVKGMRQRLKNPPLSPDQLADSLERCGLPQSANYLRQDIVAILI